MSVDTPASYSNEVDRPFPPIAWLSSAALGLVIVGGILMASYAPRRAPLGIAEGLLVGGLVLLGAAAALLYRLRDFAWRTFTTVFKWALLAYAITAGMIEFAFVRDQTRGTSLVVVTLMLVVFALSVPLTIGFTVARFAQPD
jgi:hypothetical protein